MLQRAVEAGVETLRAADDPACEQLVEAMRGAQGIVDALLGTGLNRPIDGPIKDVLDRLAEARADRTLRPHLVAIDVPSGVNPDTGTADPAVVRADTTVALGFAKVGLFAMPARAIAGDDRGGRDRAARGRGATTCPTRRSGCAISSRSCPSAPTMHTRARSVPAVIAAGSKFYPGAARLASESALRGGAGLVVLAAPESIQPLFAGMSPEVTHHPLPGNGAAAGDSSAELLAALEGCEALLIGPGLTNSPGTVDFVRGVLDGVDAVEGLQAAVIDADALNALSEIPDWHEGLSLPRVLTPHPGEMARLLGTSVDEVQADRLGAATGYAQRTGSVVVLKGAGTIVAHTGRARAALGVLERGAGDGPEPATCWPASSPR